MRIRLACMLVLFSFFGCGNRPEVVEGPLTQEVLERHLVDLGPVRYTADDGWNWTCERVYVIIRQSSTDAEVRVYEKGNKRTGTVRGIPRYAAGSRNATYHLVRNSGNDDWYINTSEGEPVRKFGILKIRLALRTGEFVKTEEPEKISKSLKPTEPSATSQVAGTLQESLQAEGEPDFQPSLDELQMALSSLEDSIRNKEALLFSDTIVVKGGKEIECEIVSEDVDSVHIRTDMGTADVLRDRIISVTHATQQEEEVTQRAKSEFEEMQRQVAELEARIRELESTAQSHADQEERTETQPDHEPGSIAKEDGSAIPGEESATAPTSIKPDVPVQELAPQRPARAGLNLIKNGDFSDGLSEWEKTHSSKAEDVWEVAVKGQEKYLSWSRERSGNDGGTVGVIQQMQADVGGFEKLMLSVNVRVLRHTLGGPGRWAEQRGGSGEYPAKILIYYKDAEGKSHVWTHGFLSEVKGRTSLTNFSNVPWDTWYHYEVDLMDVAELVDMDFERRGQQLPSPATITAVKLLGQGWDLAADVDNVELLGSMY